MAAGAHRRVVSPRGAHHRRSDGPGPGDSRPSIRTLNPSLPVGRGTAWYGPWRTTSPAPLTTAGLRVLPASRASRSSRSAVARVGLFGAQARAVAERCSPRAGHPRRRRGVAAAGSSGSSCRAPSPSPLAGLAAGLLAVAVDRPRPRLPAGRRRSLRTQAARLDPLGRSCGRTNLAPAGKTHRLPPKARRAARPGGRRTDGGFLSAAAAGIPPQAHAGGPESRRRERQR